MTIKSITKVGSQSGKCSPRFWPATPWTLVVTTTLVSVYAVLVSTNGHRDGFVFDPLMEPPQRHDTFVVITDNPFVMTGIPAQRRKELETSISMNLASPYVSQLHLLNRAQNDSWYPGGKLNVYELGRRSTLLDAIRYANAVLPAKTLFAIANADIVFLHDSVRLVARIRDERAVVALSRHDVSANGSASVYGAPHLSQDAWLMRTPFPEHPGFAFPLGSLGSDNKAAFIFQELGLSVYNWPYDVVVWHFHMSQHRRAKPRLPLPYAEVPPTRPSLHSFVYSWTRHKRIIGPNTFIQVVATDLPRFADLPQHGSNVDEKMFRPPWTPQILTRVLQLATKRMRAVKSRTGLKAAHERHSVIPHFLDLPWQALARDAFFESSELLMQIQSTFTPTISLTDMFALVPEDLAARICAESTARAWNQISISTYDVTHTHIDRLICPLRPSSSYM